MKRHDYPYDFSEKYSYGDFTGHCLAERDDMDGIAIYGSCFSQEVPDTESLPKGLNGVTFVACNLDNVLIPPGNTVIDCSQKRFQVQNDGNDWLIDDKGMPEKPVNYRMFEKLALPMPKPEDIPAEKQAERVDLKTIAETQKAEAPK